MSEQHPIPGGDDRMRLSDAERRQVVDALTRHTADGRLAMDEFEQRSEQALAARTRSDLNGLLSDLPTAPGAHGPATLWAGAPPVPTAPMPPPPHPARPRSAPIPGGLPPAGHPRWRLERLRGVMVLGVILTAIWLMSGAGYFWPMWIIVPIGLGVLFGGGHHGCARRGAGPTPPGVS